MFTNWLTGTTGGLGAGLNSNPGDNRGNSSLPPNSNPSGAATSAAAINSGHILMSTPPDVVLEVGPAPGSVRFVAHSIVLGMHSGYLRSAIRLDEHSTAAAAATNGTPSDFVLFLGNVTAEQFAPLLTYMYTGYLDLNVENIFGVLLATHVLHMPRALEICRAFLARAQTEGYLGSRLNNLVSTNPGHPTPTPPTATVTTGNGKIIRPIPSKATLPNFGFLPAIGPPPTASLPTITPHQHQQQQHQQQQQLLQHSLISFKGLQRQSDANYSNPIMSGETLEHHRQEQQQQRPKSEEIDVDQESIKAASETGDIPRQNVVDNENHIVVNDDDDNDNEDEEVFIDSTSNTDTDIDETEVIIECRRKPSKSTVLPTKRQTETTTSKVNSVDKLKNSKKNENRNKIPSSSSKQPNRSGNSRRDKRNRQSAIKSRSNSGLQIAKAPIPASQLDANEGSKVIIDVASCDGPVRFRRILNTAYGHKPEDFAPQIPERSQQSVSYSFHQQMARTINQQRQQLQQQNSNNCGGGGNGNGGGGCGGSGGGEESENSDGSKHGGSSKNNNNNNNNNSNEIYVCVYCKHTFKSQYCYQKHAKRHLNPLSLTPSSTERGEKPLLNPHFNGPQFSNNITAVTPIPLPLVTSKQTATEMLRREVRPLDMNVQYYPCKTCGSKFPSYYFVHKHRKMCHADEESTPSKDNVVQRNGGELETETGVGTEVGPEVGPEVGTEIGTAYVAALNRNGNDDQSEIAEDIELKIDEISDGNRVGRIGDNNAEHESKCDN